MNQVENDQIPNMLTQNGNQPQKIESNPEKVEQLYTWGQGCEPSKEIVEEFEKRPESYEVITHMKVTFM